MSACQIGLLFISTDEQWYLCSMDILHVRHSFMALLMKWRVNGLTALPASAWQTQHEKDWLMHHVPWWVSRSVSPFHDNREVDVLLSISTSHHLTRSTHLWFLLASGVANFGKRCFEVRTAVASGKSGVPDNHWVGSSVFTSFLVDLKILPWSGDFRWTCGCTLDWAGSLKTPWALVKGSGRTCT